MYNRRTRLILATHDKRHADTARVMRLQTHPSPPLARRTLPSTRTVGKSRIAVAAEDAEDGRDAAAAAEAGGDPEGRDADDAEEEGGDGDGRTADPGSDSSEDELPNRNTVGKVPLVWYKDEEHIGYDIDGQQITRTARKDKLQQLLDRNDSKKVRGKWGAREGGGGRRGTECGTEATRQRRIARATCEAPRTGHNNPILMAPGERRHWGEDRVNEVGVRLRRTGPPSQSD